MCEYCDLAKVGLTTFDFPARTNKKKRKKRKKNPKKAAVPSHHWSRRSNVVWRCCSDPASSWSEVPDSAKTRKQTQVWNMRKTLWDKEMLHAWNKCLTFLYQNKNPVYASLDHRGWESMWRSLLLQPHLEPLILQDLLDGNHLLAVDEASLVHHTKRPITDHLQGLHKEETPTAQPVKCKYSDDESNCRIWLLKKQI